MRPEEKGMRSKTHVSTQVRSAHFAPSNPRLWPQTRAHTANDVSCCASSRLVWYSQSRPVPRSPSLGGLRGANAFRASLARHTPIQPRRLQLLSQPTGVREFTALKQACSTEYHGAQGAFKDSMIHGILQFTLPIAFRCVLHRWENQEIRCRKLCRVGWPVTVQQFTYIQHTSEENG